MNRTPLLIIAVVATLVAGIFPPGLLLCQSDSSKEPDAKNVYRVGPDITPPRIIYSPDPTYDEASRKAKVSGIVVLAIVVNSEGNAEDVKVTKSLSHSLDQRAIDAVAQWRFTPAMKDGKPVAVRTYVRVKYSLY
jgi:protein TonB